MNDEGPQTGPDKAFSFSTPISRTVVTRLSVQCPSLASSTLAGSSSPNVDIYLDPMLNVADTATYLNMPASTLGVWKRLKAVHSVASERQGWPNLPFVAVVEAFVLRSLRTVGFSQQQIREAAAGVRKEFNDKFALARPNIGHDGVDIFIDVGGDLFRARDRQQAVRETVQDFTRCIDWNGEDPERLRLIHFGNVVLDPRFGWGRPVVADTKVPLEAILGLWRGGDSVLVIAEEFGMPEQEVQGLIQAWDRARDAAA